MVSKNQNSPVDLYLDPSGMTPPGLNSFASFTAAASWLDSGASLSEDAANKIRKPYTITKNKKEEKRASVVQLMDHCKKMQCWVMLKRLMTGRDSWVFKHPMMGLEILDNNYSIVDHHHESKSLSKPFIKSLIVYSETTMKPSDLKDIESKFKKCLYTEHDEFADDISWIKLF